jgi:hypothetical protein
MGTSAPDAVKRLVDRFDQDRKVFLSADYKEEQLRAESGPRPSIRHSYLPWYGRSSMKSPSRSQAQPKPWPTPSASAAAAI